MSLLCLQLSSTVLTRARAFAASLWAFVAAKAIPSGKDGDAREAASLSDGRPEGTVGAVWVGAAPWPWLQALHITVCAALTTARCSAWALAVPSERRQNWEEEKREIKRWNEGDKMGIDTRRKRWQESSSRVQGCGKCVHRAQLKIRKSEEERQKWTWVGWRIYLKKRKTGRN